MPPIKNRWRAGLSRRIILLTAATGLVSLLALLGRHHWVLDLFTHFFLHYTIMAAVFALLLVLLGRPRWAMLAGMLMLLNGARLLPYWQTGEAGQTAADDGERVTLLQFNVQGRNDNIAGIMNWLESRAAEVDILVLLEVTPAWKPQLEKLGSRYPDGVWELREDNFGIALLTRLPTESLQVEDIGGHDLPSIVLTALTPRSNRPLILYATHPAPPTGEYLSDIRDSQFAALAAELAAHRGQSLILAGDLNATIWSTPFKKLVAVTGLRDAQAGLGYLGTWPNRLLPARLGIPIDHTLISGSLQTIRRETGPGLGSDHFPVITTLALPGQAGSTQPVP